MAHKEHRHERAGHEDGGVREEHGHAELVHQETGEHRRDDLRGHAGRVVKAGVAADVAAGAHLHDHRERVDVDGGPADAGEAEHGVHEHRGALGVEKGGHAERDGQHHDAAEDGLLAADLGRDDADGQVGHDGGGLCEHEREVVVLVQDVARVDGVFRRHGVVAEEPQHDRQQQEDERPALGLAELARPCGRVVIAVIDAEALAVGLHLGHELRLVDRQAEDQQRHQHDARDHGEVRRVAHERVAHGARGEGHADGQHEDTAGSAHEVDDGIRLAAQRFDGNIGHERDGGGAERGHGHEHDEQQRDKADERAGVLHSRLVGVGLARGHDIVRVVVVRHGLALGVCDLTRDGGKFVLGERVLEHERLAVWGLERAVGLLLVHDAQRGGIVDGGGRVDAFQLRIVDERQADERDGRDDRAEDDERRAAAAPAGVLVGDRAEQRQQKQRQNVVECHDDAGPRLRHAELVRQDQRDGVVIRLPEGADQEKGKANADGALVVELHWITSISLYRICLILQYLARQFNRHLTKSRNCCLIRTKQTGGPRRRKEDSL